MIRHWQDIVFSFGTIAFTVALIPALKRKMYPPISTCIITGIMLIFYVAADATLDLWLSATTTLMSVFIWLLMGVKQIDRNH
jgi:hypothetical protein